MTGTVDGKGEGMEEKLENTVLEDCPFCGGAALLEEENGWCFYVACVDCGAKTAAFPYETPGERRKAAGTAAHIWNIGKAMRPDNGE